MPFPTKNVGSWPKKLALNEQDLNPSEMYKKIYDKYMKDFKLPTDTEEYRPLYANNN